MQYGVCNMIASNKLLLNSTIVTIRAYELGCTVQSILGNVILCSRKSDDSYITWRASIYGGHAEFISGCYDMTQKQGEHNLIERALGYDILAKSGE